MATWVGPPKSYSKGRTRPVQYVVIHATDGSEGPTSAEDGAAYDKRRTDGTSTHLFVDADTAVREVVDEDRAHHARFHGNEIGIGIELCGRAGQTDTQWHDPASNATLAIAAREVAVICAAHGIPVRRLTVAEVRAAYYAPEGQRPKGICGHIDITNAYPEDNGTHTDPGQHFPWDEFLAAVRSHQTTGDDMGLTDVLPGTTSDEHPDGVTLGEAIGAMYLAGIEGRRNAPNQTANGGLPLWWPPAEFIRAELGRQLSKLPAGTPIDLDALADKVAARLIDRAGELLQQAQAAAAAAP